MEKEMKFSHKQNAKNAGWSFLGKMVLSIPPLVGIYGGLLLESRYGWQIGLGIGLTIGVIGWWFMPSGKSTMVEVERD